MENILQSICERNLIRYAVQRQIFCKLCGTILDYRRAALVDATAPHGTSSMFCICQDCDREHIPNFLAAAKREGCTVEISRLYRPRKPAPTADEIRAKEERKAARMASAYVDRHTGNLFAKRRA